jgi:formyl-CoA transferase
MFESSVSWLTVPITLSASFGKRITRKGNTHEFFCPVFVYKTRNGFIYLAVGNDRQWAAMVSQDVFKALDKPEYKQNSGRVADAANLHQAISAITSQHSSEFFLDLFSSITVPVSKIKTIPEIIDDPLVKEKLLTSQDPISKKKITLAPAPYITPYLKTNDMHLKFPPRFGEHNREIYGDLLGYSEDELARLKFEETI